MAQSAAIDKQSRGQPRHPPVELSAAAARRLLVGALGLGRRSPWGRGEHAVGRAIQSLGYVQIDTISVVERAHHHVLSSRLPGYRAEHLEAGLNRTHFEYWGHAAAYLPLQDYRFARPLMQAHRERRARWVRCRDDVLTGRVLDAVRANGPMMARDFETPAGSGGGWWRWKPAKQALEHLFMTGELTIVRRDGFQKCYDLTERVLPQVVDQPLPSAAENARHHVLRYVRSHGLGHEGWLKWLQPVTGFTAQARAAVAGLIAAGELVPVTIRPDAQAPDPGPGWLSTPAALTALPGRSGRRWLLLSPFDPLVLDRDRLLRLFGFEYRLECYTPAPQRRWGYFTLPMLHGTRLRGRADVRVQRRQRTLRVDGLHPEPGFTPLAEDADLIDAIAGFAAACGCESVEFARAVLADRPRGWQVPA